ncbi:MAG: N-acetylgalactosamine-6-sulfatase, partial [Verrucomicrobiaceae bacterium]
MKTVVQKILTFITLGLLLAGSSLSIAAPASKPNIIVVLIDDMGWGDLSCYGGEAPTPAIDRLAKEGIRFTNFYSNSPICSPSRVALTTGQYPQRWRITSFLENRQGNKRRGMAQWLDPKAPVLARELKKAGYATGHFGKWHMGGQRDVGDAPLITEYGFDKSLTNFEGLGPRVLPLLGGKGGKKHDLGSGNLGRGPIMWEDRSVITSSFVRDAVKFIDESRSAKKPFFINLWPDDVHSPFFPPEELRKKNGKRALYHAVVTTMDKQLGVLFDRIRDDAELRDNTMVVLLSDNGPEQGAGTTKHLKGTKGSLYEGGIREPLIVWAPGLMNKESTGKTNTASVLSSIDVNRSLHTLVGVPLAEGATPDGEDFSDTLMGKAERQRSAPIFWRRPPDRPGPPDARFPDMAVRDGNWKCHVSYDGKKVALFDLSKDESETRDVAAGHPEVAERLSKAVLAWNAKLPADAGDPAFKP